MQAISDFINSIQDNMNKNLYTIAIYMDLSKAFDTVDKNILGNKLTDIGINNKAKNLIYDYMSNRKFCFSDKPRETFSLEYGVPQGSVLGPLLFLIYLYDIKNICTNTKKIVYADDTTLIVTGKNKEEAIQNCNNILKNIYTYFTNNKLTINPTKTQYMTFTKTKNNNNKHRETTIHINKTPLEEVQTFKLLGVVINNRLNWDDHKLYVKSKICRSIGILYNCRNIFKQTDLLTTYRTFIEPFLLYCLPIWGHTVTAKNDMLVKLQNKVLRILYQCYRTEDAWRHTNNEILSLNNLYKHETAKLCYNHQTNKLPFTYKEENMPNIEYQHDPERKYSLRCTNKTK